MAIPALLHPFSMIYFHLMRSLAKLPPALIMALVAARMRKGISVRRTSKDPFGGQRFQILTATAIICLSSSSTNLALSAVFGDAGPSAYAPSRERKRKRVSDTELEVARAYNGTRPVYKLPYEILALIFTADIPDIGSCWPIRPLWAHSHFEAFVHAINATCSLFRNAIIHTPECWQWVDLYSHQVKHEVLVESLQIRLRRSEPYEFSLKFGEKFAPYSSKNKEFLEILDILQPHLPRCRSIELYADSTVTVAHELFKRVPMPKLRHMALSWTFKSTKVPAGPPASLARNIARIPPLPRDMPPMESFSYLIRHPLPQDVRWLPIKGLDTSRLTRLRVGVSLKTRDVIYLLRHAPVLEHFHWYSARQDEQAVTVELLDLPKLISMTLAGSHNVLEFPDFTAPKLEQLVVSSVQQGIPAFIDPPLQAYPALRRLSLDAVDSPPFMLSQFIEANSGLEEIDLDFRAESEIDIDDMDTLINACISPIDRDGEPRDLHLTRLSFSLLQPGKKARKLKDLLTHRLSRALVRVFAADPDIEVWVVDDFDMLNLEHKEFAPLLIQHPGILRARGDSAPPGRHRQPNWSKHRIPPLRCYWPDAWSFWGARIGEW